uniref:Uncharacterized protein n=1 Tax=Chromera velia CCMP2878 TaxID=1169474 RepID=A0A0G4HEP6_9ALVE|eukprot:Cvel_26828.t1-p1 / transcript=Cvel_26828.t1 / gene=Cvel_26828 / organism=Chromera_velia_CCMP2878 / gene_product=hypothetical protein / transcript_product=hypothetical protein / location=Cvel_scaffold3251:7258-10248(-) / protein_length=573 / sequence_SO=supercontig / SO=protein_coding / is_pseudo=false
MSVEARLLAALEEDEDRDMGERDPFDKLWDGLKRAVAVSVKDRQKGRSSSASSHPQQRMVERLQEARERWQLVELRREERHDSGSPPRPPLAEHQGFSCQHPNPDLRCSSRSASFSLDAASLSAHKSRARQSEGKLAIIRRIQETLGASQTRTPRRNDDCEVEKPVDASPFSARPLPVLCLSDTPEKKPQQHTRIHPSRSVYPSGPGALRKTGKRTTGRVRRPCEWSDCAYTFSTPAHVPPSQGMSLAGQDVQCQKGRDLRVAQGPRTGVWMDVEGGEEDSHGDLAVHTRVVTPVEQTEGDRDGVTIAPGTAPLSPQACSTGAEERAQAAERRLSAVCAAAERAQKRLAERGAAMDLRARERSRRTRELLRFDPPSESLRLSTDSEKPPLVLSADSEKVRESTDREVSQVKHFGEDCGSRGWEEVGVHAQRGKGAGVPLSMATGGSQMLSPSTRPSRSEPPLWLNDKEKEKEKENERPCEQTRKHGDGDPRTIKESTGPLPSLSEAPHVMESRGETLHIVRKASLPHEGQQPMERMYRKRVQGLSGCTESRDEQRPECPRPMFPFSLPNGKMG